MTMHTCCPAMTMQTMLHIVLTFFSHTFATWCHPSKSPATLFPRHEYYSRSTPCEYIDTERNVFKNIQRWRWGLTKKSKVHKPWKTYIISTWGSCVAKRGQSGTEMCLEQLPHWGRALSSSDYRLHTEISNYKKLYIFFFHVKKCYIYMNYYTKIRIPITIYNRVRTEIF